MQATHNTDDSMLARGVGDQTLALFEARNTAGKHYIAATVLAQISHADPCCKQGAFSIDINLVHRWLLLPILICRKDILVVRDAGVADYNVNSTEQSFGCLEQSQLVAI